MIREASDAGLFDDAPIDNKEESDADLIAYCTVCGKLAFRRRKGTNAHPENAWCRACRYKHYDEYFGKEDDPR